MKNKNVILLISTIYLIFLSSVINLTEMGNLEVFSIVVIVMCLGRLFEYNVIVANKLLKITFNFNNRFVTLFLHNLMLFIASLVIQSLFGITSSSILLTLVTISYSNCLELLILKRKEHIKQLKNS